MRVICGFDEAGRGPLAGPVVAACVILGPNFDTSGLADSKVLTPRRRELLDARIRAEAAAWGLASCSPAEIDSWNILQASLEAMRRSWFDLVERFPGARADVALIDGLHCPELPLPAEALVHGDALEPAISAASILAKVFRDREMVRLGELYPHYGFERHKGYPTADHRRAIARWGACPEHRLSFRWA